MPIPVDEVLEPDTEMSLTIRNEGHTAPRRIPIERKTYTIGRQEGVDILIDNPSVSRQHARIFFLHDEEIIDDLNSTNGTLVNGVRVTRCVLQDNDIIRIGDATILFSRTASNETHTAVD
ncbi:MAG: FHA domain-containing protein [Kiritimatiellia bacterium]